jgi:phage terminase large subunit-like protein
VIKITSKQFEALKLLASKAKNILLYGGSRSGKTVVLVYAIIMRAINAPGTNHLIVRKHLNHALESLWLKTLPHVIKIIDPALKERCKFNAKYYYVEFPNGSKIWIGGTDDDERIEKILGNEYSTIFINETSQVPWLAVDMLGTRLAEKSSLKNKMYFDCNPPKKSHWTYTVFKDLLNPKDKRPLNKDDYASMLMNPDDNIENISEDYIKRLDELTESEKKRFRHGEFGESNIGEFFKAEWIDRIYEVPSEMDRIVVSIDPAVSNTETSNETGITVTARKGDFGFVLEDGSGKYSPNQWAQKAIDLYRKWNADAIVAEVNNGGDMIEAVINNIDKNVRVIKVHATRGKIKRAEPVTALYEKHRIKHYDYLTELEDQMFSFTNIIDDKGNASPDKCDSMIWGFTELFGLGAMDRTLGEMLDVPEMSKESNYGSFR